MSGFGAPRPAVGMPSGGVESPVPAAIAAGTGRRRPLDALIVLPVAEIWVAGLVADVSRLFDERLGRTFAERIPPPATLLTLHLALLLLLIAGGLSLRRSGQRGNGILMLAIVAAAGLDVILTRFSVWGPNTFLDIPLPWLTAVLLAHLLLRWPGDRLASRWQRIGIVAAYITVPLPFVATSVLLRRSPPDLVDRAGSWEVVDGTAYSTLWTIGTVWFDLLLIAFVLLIVGRLVTAPLPERRELSAVAVASGLLALSGFVVPGFDGLSRPWDDDLLANLALAVVPVAFLLATVVRRVQRAAAVEALVTDGQTAQPDDVVGSLRRAMGDPRLQVATYSTALGVFVDPSGVPAPDVSPGRAAVLVPDGSGAPLARLDVDARLAARPELTGSVARAALIALETTRLRAELALRAADEAAVRKQLDDAAEEGERLSRLLPGGLPEKLRQDPGALGRIDEAEVTVLMSDVRGYSTIAEHTAPGRLAQQLQEHREAMNHAILQQGGTVMQYVGDAVMAVFGAPFAQPDHPERAVRAAAAMHDGQRAVNERWAAVGWDPFELGIGLSTGPVATAVLGSADRYEYTVVGDTVNLAQRLESQARPGGTTIASAATVADLEHLRFDPLEELFVKGRSAPVFAFRISAAVIPPIPDRRPNGAGS